MTTVNSAGIQKLNKWLGKVHNEKQINIAHVSRIFVSSAIKKDLDKDGVINNISYGLDNGWNGIIQIVELPDIEGMFLGFEIPWM